MQRQEKEGKFMRSKMENLFTMLYVEKKIIYSKYSKDGTVQLFGTKGQKFLIVPGQRDNGKSSKSCHRLGQDRTWDGTSTIFFLLFPVLEHLFLFEYCP